MIKCAFAPVGFSFGRKSGAALALALGLIGAPAAALTLNITDTGFDPVPAGGPIHYQVRVQNAGNTRSNTDTLEFAIPAGTTYAGTTGGLTDCTPPPTVKGPETVSCPIPDLAPRGQIQGGLILVPDTKSVVTLQGLLTGVNITGEQTTTVNNGADLALAFEAPATIRAGDLLGFDAVITNHGPDPAESATFTTLLPAALRDSITVPAGCSIAGDTISCTVPGPIAVDDSVRLTFATTVMTDNQSSLAVAGSIAGINPADPDLSNDAADFTVIVEPGTDLTLHKSRAPSGLLYLGQDVTFTLVPGFAGNVPLAAEITDSLPPNYEFLSVTPTPDTGWSCNDANPVACTYESDIADAADYRAPITIAARPITETATGAPVTNIATIAPPADADANADVRTDNNTASDGGADIVKPATDLVAHKSGPAHGLVTVGNSYDWQIWTSNIGNIGFAGTLELIDHLPAGLELTGLNAPAGWSCSPLSGTGPMDISCTSAHYTEAAPLAVGARTPAITLTTKVLTGGALSNALTVDLHDPNYDDRDLTNNKTSSGVNAGDDITVAVANLRLTKTVAAPGPHPSGTPVAFTVTVFNEGDGLAEDVIITDRLNDLYFPDATTTAVTLDSVPADAVCTVTRGASFYSDLRCSIAELPAGESRAITFTAAVGGEAGLKTNRAETYSTLTPDPDYSDNNDSADYTVTARSDVTVEKTASHAHLSEVQAGQELKYVLTAGVPNLGLSAAANVTVTDTLPAGLRFVSATASQGSCLPPTNLDAKGITTATSQLVCNLGTVTNNNTQTVTISTVPTTAIAGTTITNPVTVSTTTPEIDATNNTALISHKITRPSLDLVTNKTDGADPVELGETVTYTITTHNSGPSEAFNLVMTDILPQAGMKYQAHRATYPGMTCTEADGATPGSFGGKVVCTLANLPVGRTASFEVDMTAEQRGRWVNRVEARSDEYADEPIKQNNDVNENTTVFERANLKVTKVASTSPVDLRAPFNWVITVENVTATGIGMAENVVLRDTLPANMEIVGAVTTAGVAASCDAPVGGRALICIADEMAADEDLTITLPVRVTSVTLNPEAVSNSATVTTDSFETDTTDNTDTGTVQVRSTSVSGAVWRDFNESGTREAHDSGIPGLPVTLTGTDAFGTAVIRQVNTAADGSYDFGLLPPGTYSVSYVPPTDGTYAAGSALPGAAGGGTPDGTIRIGTITVTTDTPSGGNDFTLIPQAGIALAKEASQPVFQSDGSYRLTYTFRIRNDSQEPLSSLSLTDDLVTSFGTYVTGTPDHGEFAVLSASGGTLTSGANAQLSLDSAVQVAAGATHTITMVLSVNPALPRKAAVETHTNRATIAAEGLWSGQEPDDGSNNGSTPVRGTKSDTTRNVTYAPAITLNKTAVLDKAGATAAPGDQIRYTFTVTNTGNTPLLGVTLADPLPDLVWDTTGPIARLNPGQADSTTFTAHYILTQADIEAGGVDNTATASGRWAEDGVTNPIVSNSDDAAITALAEPGLTVVKARVSDDIQDPTEPGDTIRYSFTVTNTGNVELRDLVLSDVLPGIVFEEGGDSIGTLARAGQAGNSVIVHAEYAVTQADIDAGEVINLATVTGSHGPDDTSIEEESNEIITPLHPRPLMRVTKLADRPLPTNPQAGDSIGWTITIENTGNTTLEIGTITEPLADAPVVPLVPVLAPGEKTTATATHTLTQTEIDAGEVVNQVRVAGKVPGPDTPFRETPSGNDPETPNEEATVTPLPAHPDIALLKVLDSDVSGPLMPGDVIEFAFTIRNTGNVTLTDLVLADHLAGVDVDAAILDDLSLAPKAEVLLRGTYTLTAADLEAGGLENSATVTGDDPHGTQVTDESGTGFDNDDPTPVALIRQPQIALIKTISAAPQAPVMAGDQIEYAFEIRNTGNVALHDIALVDLVGDVEITGSLTSPLAAGAVDTDSFTGLYTLTQADIDAGNFANTAEVTGTGTGPDGTPVTVEDQSGTDVTNDLPTEFPIPPAPALEIVKSANADALQEPPQPDDEITYSFTVTNTGNVTLHDVTVTDPLLGGDFAGNLIASLAPGAEATVTGTYPITQADIETGVVLNIASVTGDYTDPETGEPATTTPVESEEIAVLLDQEPHLAVIKQAASAITDPAEVGQVITYTFTIRNLGNVTINNVTLTDPLPGLTPAAFPAIGDMAPQSRHEVTATYAITQEDIDAGEVVNQAIAAGTHAGEPVRDLSGPDSSSDEETVVPVPQGPALELVKTADASGLSDPAVPEQQIRYGFTVTNTGNVTLRDVSVSDPLPGLAPAEFAVGTLAPGQSASVGPAIYAITPEDIIAGKVENRALASGLYGPPDDPGTVDTPSHTDEDVDGPTVTPIAGVPSIALVKTLATGIDPTSLRLGDEIRWAFTVTNTGNVPLTNVTVTEEMVDVPVIGGPITLAPGAVDNSTFTASHVITQDDLDAGFIENRALASGVFDNGTDPAQTVTDQSGTTVDNNLPTRTELGQRPDIDLVKTVDVSGLSTPPLAGQLLRYAFTITNTGEITLSNVTLSDELDGLVLTGTPIPSLAPGAENTTAYSATYALTQADIDSGRALENQAEVTGNYTDAAGNPRQVSDLSGTEAGTNKPTVVEITRAPGLELEKIADDTGISSVATVGEEIAYTFRLTNTGNVTLTDVTVDDPLPGLVLSGAPITLAPGEVSEAITGVYAITLVDIRAAERPNTATAQGNWVPEEGPPQTVPSNESSALVELGYPEIALDITVGELRDLNGDGRMGPGDLVFFRYEVTNTGTVPLHEVNLDMGSLSLPLAGLVCAPISLEVGESAFLECTGGAYTITEADLGDRITLSGDATGTSDAGVVVRASSAASTVPDAGAGGLVVEKLALVETAMIGDLVPYEIRVSSDTGGVPVRARLVDLLPEGFAYQAGSARLDGVAVDLEVSGRTLVLDPLEVQPGAVRVLRIEARVGSSVQPGSHLNRARLLSGTTGMPIAPEATAAVRVLADAVLQCASVLGRVFDDTDQNGHMSLADEERGLPNVRLIAPNGLAITTDAHGRFNVPCAALPRAIGANFMLKLDERTLPAGYRITTENPRVVRLTPGMVTRLDFGATLARLVRIDLAANAFTSDGMSPALEAGLAQMVAEIRDQVTMLRLTYVLTGTETRDSAGNRLRLVERAVRALWQREGQYKLNIETVIERMEGVK